MSSFDNNNLDDGYGDNANASRKTGDDSYGSNNHQEGAALGSSDRPYGSSDRDNDNNNNLDKRESSGINNNNNSNNSYSTDTYGASGDNDTYGSGRQTDAYGSSTQEGTALGSSTGSRRNQEDTYGAGGNNNNNNNNTINSTHNDDDDDNNNNNNDSYGGSSRPADRRGGASGGREPGLSADTDRRDDGAYGASQTDSYGGGPSGDGGADHGAASSRTMADEDGAGSRPARGAGADSTVGKFVEKAGALLHREGLAEKGREKREQKGFGNGDEY